MSEEGYESGCLIRELGAQQCRPGCQVCHLETKLTHLNRICPDLKEGPGLENDSSQDYLLNDATFSACANQLVGIVTDMLDTCSEPKWLVSNDSFQKYLEFVLWESFRYGVSLHCSGSGPCLWIDTDKLLALIRKAMGKRYIIPYIQNR